MRIVTWNCCGGFTAKYPLLRDLDFDLAVVPECGPMDSTLGQRRRLTHVMARPVREGRKYLGAFAQHPWHVEPLTLEASADMPWLVPVRVTGPVGFTLLAIWTQSQPRPYTAQTHRVVTEVLPEISGPVVLAGDLNAPDRDGTPGLRRHLRTVDLLYEAGLVSAFAATRAVKPTDAHTDGPDGELSLAMREPTYFHHRKRDQAWHLDHVFVPHEWTPGIATWVGTYDEWVATGRSDHVPVVVEVEPSPDTSLSIQGDDQTY